MNKKFISKVYPIFLNEVTWRKWKYRLKTKLKKFKKSSKKRFFIRYKYPHRKSNSKYKSFVTIRRYLLKSKLWYRSKKNCLRFYNFEKSYTNENIIFNKIITCNYDEEIEFNKVF